MSIEATRFCLTTIDNDVNPFDDFKKWYFNDLYICELRKSLNIVDCCALLSKHCLTSDEMTEIEINKETERAIDEIIELYPGIFMKVSQTYLIEDDESL